MPKFGPVPKALDHAKAESLAALGATNDQLAAALGVAKGTLFNARKRDKALDEAIKNGKDKADLAVVGSLYKKATSGDTTAMIFWLKNRRPTEWKDRKDVGLGNTQDEDGKPKPLIIKVVHVKDGDKGNGNGNGNGGAKK